MARVLRTAFLTLAATLLLASCTTLNDDRIPSMGVNVNLENQGLWNSFGVSGYGQRQYFILSDRLRVPVGFQYVYGSMTGYGGVLLISGFDPRTGDIGPLAFDLSCPVERLPDVRVEVDPDNFDAVCPVCGSHYNVVEQSGSPISGPAKSMKYALRPYRCYPSSQGGYLITNPLDR